MDLNAVIIVIAKTNDKQFAGTVLSYWLQYLDSAIGLLLNNFKKTKITIKTTLAGTLFV